MSRFLLFLVINLLVAGPLFSQEITVISELTGKPVADAAVTDNSGNIIAVTDRAGKAKLPERMLNATLCIQHFAFELLCLPADSLTAETVKLTEKVFDIGEFVVSANRWEQNRNEVPNRITSIQAPEIRFSNPQTAADLIGKGGQVFIQKSQLGGGSPMIRGFAANRLLIVVDGVRMNNAIYREGNIQNIISLDPNVIESSEVIFGPGAFMYGSDAIGGVMDFHTSEPVLSGTEKINFRGNAFSRYSSANSEKTFNASVNLGGKKTGLYAGITYSGYGDQHMGKGGYEEYLRKEYVSRINGKDSVVINSDPRLQVGSGYSQLNSTVKFRYRINNNINLVLSNHYSALSDVPRYDRLIQYRSGKPRYAEWYYGPQVWIMNSLAAGIKSSGPLFNDLKVIVSAQNYRESRHDRSLGKTVLNNQSEKLKIYSLNLDFDKKRGEKSTIFYGVEAVLNDIISVATAKDITTGTVTPAGSRYPNGTNRYFNLAAYTGYKTAAGNKFTLNTGIRYNYVSLNSRIADNSFYNFPFTEINLSNGAVTGSAGVVFRPGKRSQYSLNLATGFRAPNLDDAGKVFESAPGIVVVPNPGLKPEYAWNADIGYTLKLGESLHLELSAFFTWLDNAMVRHDFLFNGDDSIIYMGELSKVEALVNTGYARVWGFSAATEINIAKHLALKSSITVTEGKEKGGIPLRHAAPLFGSVHLVYALPLVKADLWTEFNGKRSFEDMPPSEISKPYIYAKDSNGNPWSPGWVTLNFRISADILNTVTLNAGVENILNTMYRPYSSGIVAPGRNFVISARLHF